MGLIIKSLTVRGNKGQATVKALFDTGASGSFIRWDIAARVARVSRLSPRLFSLGDGKGTMQVRHYAPLDVELEGVSLYHTFLVAKELGEEMIVGADMLQRWKIRLDPENEAVIIDPKALELKLV